MAGFFRFFTGRDDKEEQITVSLVEEVFEYGRLKNLIGACGAEWEDKPYQYSKPLNNVTLPPNIHWGAHPLHVFLVVTESGALEYRYSNEGETRVHFCPVTTQQAHIRYINEKFTALYNELGLPDSLVKLREAAQKKQAKREVPNDKMGLLKTYLKGENSDFFFDILAEHYDILMWVDWREEDDAIVRYCEDILHTGSLSALVNNSDNKLGFDVVISYKGENHIVAYPGKGADRNTTIITLNEVISPDYEIRFCKESDGSDTLAFLPLSSVQWGELEKEFGAKKMSSLFAKISKDSKLF